jgi:hypothetical protein
MAVIAFPHFFVNLKEKYADNIYHIVDFLIGKDSPLNDTIPQKHRN